MIEAAAVNQVRFNRWSYGFDPGPGNNPVARPLQNMSFPAIEPLAAALKSQSNETRQVAAYVLYELSSNGSGLDQEDFQPAIESLAAALGDRDDTVRNYAAVTLGQFHDARAAYALLDVIAAADRYSGLAGNAANEVSSFRDPKIVDQLLVLIQDERPAVRSATAQALGCMGDMRAAEPLLHLLKDPDESVRSSATMQLGNLRPPAAVEALVARLADKNPGIRSSAAEVLGRIGDRKALDRLTKLLDDTDFKVRVVAAVALLRMDDLRGTECIALGLKDADADNREFVFGQLSPPWVKKDSLLKCLIAALDDPSIRVRTLAASALGQIQTAAAADALWNKLEDGEIRQNIVSELSRMQDERALPLLIHDLDNAEPSRRRWAVEGIADYGKAAAVDPLVKCLADPTSEVRLAAIGALIKLHAKEALPELNKLLTDDDPEIRAHAARAIKRIDRD